MLVYFIMLMQGKKGFSIRKNHTRLSKGDDKLLIGVDYSCSRKGFRHKSYKKKKKSI
jgi:hypothetical protein